MAELFNDHEAVDADGEGVSYAVDVVASEVDEHDVFGTVFERAAEFVGETLIFLGGLAALDCPGDGVCDDSAGFAFDQELGGGADDLEVLAVDVE